MISSASENQSTRVQELLDLIERIEKHEGERTALAGSRQIFAAEAEAAGYDTKIIDRILSLRRSDTLKGGERDDLLDLYRQAVSISVLESWF